MITVYNTQPSYVFPVYSDSSFNEYKVYVSKLYTWNQDTCQFIAVNIDITASQKAQDQYTVIQNDQCITSFSQNIYIGTYTAETQDKAIRLSGALLKDIPQDQWKVLQQKDTCTCQQS